MESATVEKVGKGNGISITTQILVATVGGVVFGSLAGPRAGNTASELHSQGPLSRRRLRSIDRKSMFKVYPIQSSNHQREGTACMT
jgi:hypothetical protein